MDNTDIQFWSVVLAGFFSAIGLVFVGYQTMKLREEKRLTLRAWICEHGDLQLFRVFNAKGESRTRDEWTKIMDENEKKIFVPTKVEELIYLKNFGQLPALVKGREWYTLDSQPERKLVETQPYGDEFVIMPSQEKPYIFDDHGVSFYSTSGGTAYVIFDFSYVSDESKNEKRYGFMARVTRGAFMTIDTWDEKTFYSKPSKSTNPSSSRQVLVNK